VLGIPAREEPACVFGIPEVGLDDHRPVGEVAYVLLEHGVVLKDVVDDAA